MNYDIYVRKYCRLWGQITKYNQEEMMKSIYKNASSRQGIQKETKIMNVIESARLRIFQPGTEIFSQNTPRHYLYIIIKGMYLLGFNFIFQS